MFTSISYLKFLSGFWGFSRMREPWLSGAAGEMLGRAPIGARQWAISKILEPPGALRNFLACTPRKNTL